MEIVNCAQGTQEWLEARAGKITGTRLQRVMSSKKDTRKELIYELTAEKMAPLVETYQSGAMERGHMIENVLKELYTDSGVQFESVGFVIKNDWIGISPDGLMKIDGKYRGGLEVKGPQPKNTIKYWLEDKVPDEYFWQSIHYFICIDELEWLDFVIFNPDIYDSFFRKKVIRIYRSDILEHIEKAKTALADFYPEWTAEMQKLISLKKQSV